MASPEQNEQRPSDEQSSAKSTSPFSDEFAQFAKETLEQWKVPGVSLAVIDGDQVYAEVSL
jgi:CubicO group peptidase (beta-lactamase class C family)